jgi:hypothetical protein
MNKKIYAVALAIFIVMPLLAVATQRVQAQSPTISLIDQSVIEQTHTYFYVKPGGTINFTLYVQDVSSLWSWKVNVTWDNSVLQLAPSNNVTEGPFLSSNGASTTLFMEAPPTPGNIPELSSTLLENSSVSGSGALAYIAFTPQTFPFTTTINVTGIRLLNPAGNDITTVAPISKTIVVHLFGDIIGNDKVDIRDVHAVAIWYGSLVPPAPANLDVDCIGKIDIRDIHTVASAYGSQYP